MDDVYIIEYNTMFHLLLLKEKAVNVMKAAKDKDR